MDLLPREEPGRPPLIADFLTRPVGVELDLLDLPGNEPLGLPLALTVDLPPGFPSGFPPDFLAYFGFPENPPELLLLEPPERCLPNRLFGLFLRNPP